MKDKYLQYTIPDLVQDMDFIDWAKTGDEKEAKWESWLTQHPEMRDKIVEARTLVRALRFSESTVDSSVEEEIWQQINEATSTKSPSIKKRSINWLPYAAAATIALLLAFFFLNPNRHVNKVNVAAAASQQITLPDGSVVVINADSEIKYNPKTWNEERTVSLKGEAFFKVEKGAPFTVKTPQGEVKVLGTSFNVDSYGESFEVNCFTGKVEVSKREKRMVLTPGKGGKWEDNTFKATDFDPGQVQDWRNGVFQYSDASLKEVFLELERQFDIEIEAPQTILDRQYTGFFTNTQLDSALYLVTWPMRLDYQRTGNNIIISPNSK